MNRRRFLETLVGGVVAGAAVRTWPFRVYSFPSTIYSQDYQVHLAQEWMMKDMDAKYIMYGGARGGGKLFHYNLERLRISHNLLKITFAPMRVPTELRSVSPIFPKNNS